MNKFGDIIIQKFNYRYKAIYCWKNRQGKKRQVGQFEISLSFPTVSGNKHIVVIIGQPLCDKLAYNRQSAGLLT